MQKEEKGEWSWKGEGNRRVRRGETRGGRRQERRGARRGCFWTLSLN